MQTIIIMPVIVCIFYGKFLGGTNAVQDMDGLMLCVVIFT